MIKILFFIPVISFCLSISQGPQVGNNNQSSFTVGWQTDSLSDSKLKWGLSPTSLIDSVSSNEQRTWHVLIAENLLPNTRYYYQVVSNSITSLCYFTKTAVNQDTPFRFGLITDTHGGYLLRQSWERTRGHCQILLNDSADLWLNAGDVVAYDGCVNLEERFQRTLIYKNRMDSIEHYIPMYELFGNHDGGADRIWANTDSSTYCFILPEDNTYDGMGKGSCYSFDYGAAHFQIIRYTTYSAYDPLLMKWMADDFQAAKARGQLHNLVFNHWGIMDWWTLPSENLPHWKPGYWENQRSEFYHVLDTNDVELFMHGHTHYYSRTKINPQLFDGFDTVWNNENFQNDIWNISAGRFGEGAGYPDTADWDMAYYNNSLTVLFMQFNVDFRQIMIKAINIQYSGTDVWNEVVIDSFKLRPDIPGNLEAQVVSNKVVLTWGQVENGITLNGVAGYHIYRSDVSYESIRNTPQSFYTKIGSVTSADSTSFTDIDPRLSEGDKYYVVSAYDTNKGKREGNYSNEVLASNVVGKATGLLNIPANLSFHVFPNPFNHSTTIRLSKNSEGSLFIYDLKGNLIKRFSVKNNGSDIVWDGRISLSRRVVPGIYLIKYSDKNNRTILTQRLCLLH